MFELDSTLVLFQIYIFMLEFIQYQNHRIGSEHTGGMQLRYIAGALTLVFNVLLIAVLLLQVDLRVTVVVALPTIALFSFFIGLHYDPDWDPVSPTR